jgi:hypothetical protein
VNGCGIRELDDGFVEGACLERWLKARAMMAAVVFVMWVVLNVSWKFRYGWFVEIKCDACL